AVLFAEWIAGFAQLDLMRDGAALVPFWRVDDDQSKGLEVCRDTLAALPSVELDSAASEQQFPDSVIVKASAKCAAKPWRQRMLGENYRAEWGQSTKVPVFDIGK